MKILFGQVPFSFISKIFTMVDFQNLNMAHFKRFFDKELVEVENGK